MKNVQERSFTVAEENAGKRLDLLASTMLSDCSRSHVSSLIKDGYITVGNEIKKPGFRVKTGDTIYCRIPVSRPVSIRPEAIPLDIVYHDEDILLINKSPGIVVHPSPGHETGTLVNAVLHHFPDISGIGGELRPGIVHRLDKDTSGLLLIAKSANAHRHLSDQFKSRDVSKQYIALVQGVLKDDRGEIALPIGRHPTDRKKMSVVTRKGRNALTCWKVKQRFCAATLLELDIKTGRTHQIRVHLSAIGHGIIGDPVYGGKKSNRIKHLPASRQLLHACKIAFYHPRSNQRLNFEAPVPDDMAICISRLRHP